MTEKKREGPFKLNMDFNEALERFAQTERKELDMNPSEIKNLPQNTGGKELDPRQGEFDLQVDKQVEVDGVGMGVLKNGTAFLTGRGLARLVGLENLHIRTISQEWNEEPPKPRIAAIKSILERQGISAKAAHIETTDGVRPIHAYPDAICLAVLEYYAFDAASPREKARDNYRILAGKALRELIYSQVGYDPAGLHPHRFDKWHERLARNYQAAPKGFFHVFNEAHTIIYEMIQAGAPIDERTIVDGSIGLHWSRYWEQNDLSAKYGERTKYPHNYPDSHPQSKANPHHSWCYPLAALGEYRQWLQDEYIEGGKFRNYLAGKIRKGDLPPSIAQLALDAIEQRQIAN